MPIVWRYCLRLYSRPEPDIFRDRRLFILTRLFTKAILYNIMRRVSKKKEKLRKTITAHEAAKDFIRPYINRKIIAAIKYEHSPYSVTMRYSAFLTSGKKIVVNMIDGKEIKKEFSLKKIIRDIINENIKEIKKLVLS